MMTTAIVLAAGVGSRMNTKTAKQFLEVDGHEVLYYALYAFHIHPEIDAVILVTKEEFIHHCRKELVEKYNLSKVVEICAGGKERYDSVYKGLCKIKTTADDDIVLIHDGARPFVTQTMITESIACAKKCGACTVGVPAKDTIKIVDEEKYGVNTPDRSRVYQIQTPQTFRVNLLQQAYEQMYGEQAKIGEIYNITDDTMLVERYTGVHSKVVDGAYENIKITTPEDLEIAKIFVKNSFKKI